MASKAGDDRSVGIRILVFRSLALSLGLLFTSRSLLFGRRARFTRLLGFCAFCSFDRIWKLWRERSKNIYEGIIVIYLLWCHLCKSFVGIGIRGCWGRSGSCLRSILFLFGLFFIESAISLLNHFFSETLPPQKYFFLSIWNLLQILPTQKDSGDSD